MQIVTKYIGKTIISYILLIVLILLGLQIFLEFTREFPDMGTGYYGLLQVLLYVVMMLPLDIYQFFPMAGLLGSIIGLGLLASYSELVIMRVSGISLLMITRDVLKAALFLTVIMMVVGEVLAPLAQHAATANKARAMSGGQTLLTRQGIWVRSGKNFVHVDKVLPEGKLEGVTRYLFDDSGKLLLASFAADSVYKDGQWIFNHVVQTNFADESTNSSHIETQQWGFDLSPRLLGLTAIDTDQKSLPELHSYIKYRAHSGLGADNYKFIFWQRIFQPLATLVMIILAISFVFGPLRTVTMGLRMLIGIMVGFCFYIVNQFLGPMSVVYQVPPIIAAILPTILFAIAGGVLLMRVS